MKKFPFLILIVLSFLAEIIICFLIIRGIRNVEQDTVVVNECLKSVEYNYGDDSKYITTLPYTVIDTTGVVLFQSLGKSSNAVASA